jgi:hypothetical protein
VQATRRDVGVAARAICEGAEFKDNLRIRASKNACRVEHVETQLLRSKSNQYIRIDQPGKNKNTIE